MGSSKNDKPEIFNVEKAKLEELIKNIKMKILDLFCGCGGISEGFRLAGFEVAGGIDLNSDSIKTYKKNFPNAKAINANLAIFDDKMIAKEFGDLHIDVIVGGPPCQGFSSANRWHKEKDDERNRLFFEFLRFVKVLKPKAILIENVRGILTRDGGFAKKRIEELVYELGYEISSEVLNASDYGVPQKRFRAFFVAIKKNVVKGKFDFSALEKIKPVNVRDAIGELYKLNEEGAVNWCLKHKPTSLYREYLRSKSGVVANHEVRFPAEITQERISYVPQGGNWTDIPKKLFKNQRDNRHSSAFKRLKEDECSVTIDTGNAHSNYFHPLYNRIPTVREAARIQSFSDDFIFEGTRTSQYRQVGNAVPPLLAKALALRIKEIIKTSR